MNGEAVVVGVGESAYFKHGGSPDTEFQLACTAIKNAVADAGLELSQVDGLISYMDNRNSPLRLADALGLGDLKWSVTPWAGWWQQFLRHDASRRCGCFVGTR